MILMFSAAFVGFIHSLAPGHWLPVVLMSKARRWPLRLALCGALMTALGHIVLSIFIATASIWLGVQFLTQYEEIIEQYASIGLIFFGLVYALVSFLRHSSCHGHTHHGPDPEGQTAPFLFLFSTGLSPCVAVLPVFAAAATEGKMQVLLSLVAFIGGVLASILGATALARFGLFKLDHPLFEHYGDVITGIGVALTGVTLFYFPL